ncbi:hypothetical protein ACLOJK_016622 [Asimina triloba]
MSIPKWQVGLLLLVIVLSACSSTEARALSGVGHHLQAEEKVGNAAGPDLQLQVSTGDQGRDDIFEASEREVPSCPDPIHNR